MSIPANRTRNRIAREMDKEIIVCSVQDFINSYLPFVASQADLDGVKDVLKRKELVVEDPLQFTKFPRQTANIAWGRGRSAEQEVYAPLEEIANAIGEYSFAGNSPARNDFRYCDCSSNTLTSDVERNGACFTSDGPDTKRLSMSGIVVPMQFKLDGDDRIKNNIQLVSTNVQIMSEDLRRMFTFGITIEGDLATLWYHCRSHSAASHRFSFVEDPTTLIQIFISFMFSTPEQLGYDPNVTLYTTADHRYIFTIPMLPGDTLNAQSRRFRTVETISEYRLNNITGRMTRILLVKELDTGKKDPPRFVLKDVWLDKDAQTERELQSAIFYDIRSFWQGRSPESDSLSLKLFKDLHATLVSTGEYKKYFLDIVADYRGVVSLDPPIDAVSTRGLLDARYSVTPANLKVYPTPVPPPPRAFQQKRQYRVLFREFCTAVGHLETIGEVVDVLQQILTPLQLLLCAGWVHRDISAGNILAYGSDDHASASGQWQAKLADLEYATRFPPPDGYVPDAADHQIGTPYFMAHEIMAHYQLCSVQDPSERIVTSPDNEDEVDMATITGEYFRPSPAKKHTANPLAVHNFQHDLESIWWLLLWSITCRVRYLPSQIWGRYRFRTSGRLSKARSDCFLYEMDESLYEALEPSVKVLARLMNDMRFKMRHALEMRQRAGRVDAVLAYAVIHARFYGWFEYIQHRLPEIAWRDVPLGNGVMELEQFEETCAANPTVEYSSVPTIESARDSTSAPASDHDAPIYQERLEDLDMPAS